MDLDYILNSPTTERIASSLELLANQAKLDRNQGANNAGSVMVVGADGNIIPGDAVRYTINQSLTTQQINTAKTNIGLGNVNNTSDSDKPVSTAQATALAGKVSISQGTENVGKALVVGQNGNVTVGDAVKIDATLQKSDQAADAAVVGTALSGKVAVNQGIENRGKALVINANGNVTVGDVGISNNVKSAILSCFAKVAWSDNRGQTYYDALYNALYNINPDEYYITDGLFAHWDGIDNTGNGHDSTVKVWTDLISGRQWTPAGSGTPHTFGDKYLEFKPTGSGSTGVVARDCWIAPYTETPKTIEIVFRADSGSSSISRFFGWFVSRNVNDARESDKPTGCVAYASGGYFITQGNTLGYQFDLSNTAYENAHSVSATYGTTGGLYVNGAAIAANQNSTGAYSDTRGDSGEVASALGKDKMCLGGSPFYPFKGKIYSIRLYNRVLTAAEVSHNHAIDVTRFGLE